MKDEDSSKRIELLLVDLSFRFKSISNIFSFFESYKKVILFFIASLLIMGGLLFYKSIIIQDIQEIHDKSISKLRYTLKKKYKE